MIVEIEKSFIAYYKPRPKRADYGVKYFCPSQYSLFTQWLFVWQSVIYTQYTYAYAWGFKFILVVLFEAFSPKISGW